MIHLALTIASLMFLTYVGLRVFFVLLICYVELSEFIENKLRYRKKKIQHKKDTKAQIALDRRISNKIQRNAHLIKMGKFGAVSKDNSMFLKRTGIAILIFIAILIKCGIWA